MVSTFELSNSSSCMRKMCAFSLDVILHLNKKGKKRQRRMREKWQGGAITHQGQGQSRDHDVLMLCVGGVEHKCAPDIPAAGEGG